MSTLQNQSWPSSIQKETLSSKYEKCLNITEEIYKRINITFQIKKLETSAEYDASEHSDQIDSNELSNETDLFACDKTDSLPSSTEGEKQSEAVCEKATNINNNNIKKTVYKRPRKKFRKRAKKRQPSKQSESDASSDEAPLSRMVDVEPRRAPPRVMGVPNIVILTKGTPAPSHKPASKQSESDASSDEAPLSRMVDVEPRRAPPRVMGVPNIVILTKGTPAPSHKPASKQSESDASSDEAPLSRMVDVEPRRAPPRVMGVPNIVILTKGTPAPSHKPASKQSESDASSDEAPLSRMVDVEPRRAPPRVMGVPNIVILTKGTPAPSHKPASKQSESDASSDEAPLSRMVDVEPRRAPPRVMGVPNIVILTKGTPAPSHKPASKQSESDASSDEAPLSRMVDVEPRRAPPRVMGVPNIVILTKGTPAPSHKPASKQSESDASSDEAPLSRMVDVEPRRAPPRVMGVPNIVILTKGTPAPSHKPASKQSESDASSDEAPLSRMVDVEPRRAPPRVMGVPNIVILTKGTPAPSHKPASKQSESDASSDEAPLSRMVDVEPRRAPPRVMGVPNIVILTKGTPAPSHKPASKQSESDASSDEAPLSRMVDVEPRRAPPRVMGVPNIVILTKDVKPKIIAPEKQQQKAKETKSKKQTKTSPAIDKKTAQEIKDKIEPVFAEAVEKASAMLDLSLVQGKPDLKTCGLCELSFHGDKGLRHHMAVSHITPPRERRHNPRTKEEKRV